MDKVEGTSRMAGEVTLRNNGNDVSARLSDLIAVSRSDVSMLDKEDARNESIIGPESEADCTVALTFWCVIWETSP
jgi:hypothetical protein